jgi:hypothetical protein
MREKARAPKLIPSGNVSWEAIRTEREPMRAPNNDNRQYLVPATAAAIIAAVGIAASLFTHFGPKSDGQPNGVSMITTAVAYRAGATANPTVPTVEPAIKPPPAR